jgi:hypothetical protein
VRCSRDEKAKPLKKGGGGPRFSTTTLWSRHLLRRGGHVEHHQKYHTIHRASSEEESSQQISGSGGSDDSAVSIVRSVRSVGVVTLVCKMLGLVREAGLYKLNPVDTIALENAWFQPLMSLSIKSINQVNPGFKVCFQSTHGSKAPGFNPWAYQGDILVATFAFKRSAYRYSSVIIAASFGVGWILDSHSHASMIPSFFFVAMVGFTSWCQPVWST